MIFYTLKVEISYLSHDEYIKSHNWQDDIPPAPLSIAAKALRKLAKNSLKIKDKVNALKYFLRIEKINQLTDSDKKLIKKLRNE